jgi:tRNA threonylcarbamoyladenosine biosynthesis protein TsaB
MRILAIESSSSEGSVALAADGRVLQTLTFENPRQHSAPFFAAFEDLLPRLDDLDLVLVGTGPGSYNPLRSSIAAAWGFARARGIPLRGVPSLLGYDSPHYQVLGDARANQWFIATIRDAAFTSPPALVTPADAMALLDSSIPLFQTSPMVQNACLLAPSAARLALLPDAAGPAEPCYLKPPHITQPRHR